MARFFILRHGFSEANAREIVSSDPFESVPSHGLTARGREQARHAARTFFDQILAVSCEAAESTRLAVHIVSSDFRRTVETAEEFREELLQASGRALEVSAGNKRRRLHEDCIETSFFTDTRLRERNFGCFHGRPATSSYEQVWDQDRAIAAGDVAAGGAARRQLVAWGVECAADVARRAMDCVESLRKQGVEDSKVDSQTDGHGADLIVLVAHGDVLQILQTACLGAAAEEHREVVQHMQQCDLRELLFSEMRVRNVETSAEPVG